MSDDSSAAEVTAKARQRRRRRRWWLIRLGVLAVVGGYVMIFGCDRLFYHPSDATYYQPSEFGLRHEEVFFTTDDGVRLHGWFLPAEGEARGTVVHFHGNAANVTNHVVGVAWLPPAGWNVLMFDYRGFGRSAGRVTRAGTIRDGHAAIDYALSRDDVDPNQLVLFGQSLGGAVGIWVAAERPEIKAVVVDATFGDYRQIAARHLQSSVYFSGLAKAGAWLAISDGYDAIDVVDQIAPRPLLVIAGDADTICYPELGRELFDRAAEPKDYVLVPGAAHYQAVELGGAALERRILETFQNGSDELRMMSDETRE